MRTLPYIVTVVKLAFSNLLRDELLQLFGLSVGGLHL